MSKAALTRQTILLKAFELIYQNGFQLTSVDTIIATTNVTKGAFFYHFKTKEEMGLALIQEVIKPAMEESFVKPLANATYPAQVIYDMMEHLLLKAPFFQVQYGCPAVNLVSELATTGDDLMSKALYALMNQCLGAVQSSFQRGQMIGNIRSDVDPNAVADFVLAGYSGIRNMGKLFGAGCYSVYLNELKRYLNELV
ncbi:TetR/AcrR family transcriptional regulator [Spirosoma humi]